MTNRTLWVFRVTVFTLTLLVIEGFARIAFHSLYGRGYTISALSAIPTGVDVTDQITTPAIEKPNYLKTEVLHPYLGYVKDQRQRSKHNHGFYGDQNAIMKRSRQVLGYIRVSQNIELI